MPKLPISERPVPDLADVHMSDSLRRLAVRGNPTLFRKGRKLIQEGTQGDTLFIILTGRLRAYSVNDDGTHRVTYGDYLPGEFLGEMSLDGQARSANVEAATASWCVAIARPTLERHIAEDPGFAFELLAKVIRRARMATLSLRTIAFNDVYGRVVWLLNGRATLRSDGLRVVGPISQREIADWLACNRSMVSRILTALEQGGYVSVEGRTLVLRKALPPRF
jgi:CRP/FNR family cyclic AMP-dependent transcriptional regulator